MALPWRFYCPFIEIVLNIQITIFLLTPETIRLNCVSDDIHGGLLLLIPALFQLSTVQVPCEGDQLKPNVTTASPPVRPTVGEVIKQLVVNRWFFFFSPKAVMTYQMLFDHRGFARGFLCSLSRNFVIAALCWCGNEMKIKVESGVKWRVAGCCQEQLVPHRLILSHKT